MNSKHISTISRRTIIKSASAIALSAMFTPAIFANETPPGDKNFFQTRGVVLTPEDFSWGDWPVIANKAHLTTIGIHHQNSPAEIIKFIRSGKGKAVLEQCRNLGLHIEYELHAMKELLPRGLFSKNPELFTAEEKGNRTPDSNLCVSSKTALDIAAENAVAMAKILTPTTHRYFYWGDDGKPWCRCPKCRNLGDSDQALILENHILKSLQLFDPKAQLAHLAYFNSLHPPTQVKPMPGIFLEYAPINRRYDISFESMNDKVQKENLDALDANLEFFGSENAQALEYWLDVSRFSKWTRPAKKLPFLPQVFASDIGMYAKRNIRHVTTFAVYIDAEYIKTFGEPPIADYGAALYHYMK